MKGTKKQTRRSTAAGKGKKTQTHTKPKTPLTNDVKITIRFKVNFNKMDTFTK